MSTVELRKKLIERIKETEDEKLLEEVYRLLDMEVESPEVYKLNDEQRNAVHESREQFKQGKFRTDQQVNKDLDEWLER